MDYLAGNVQLVIAIFDFFIFTKNNIISSIYGYIYLVRSK